MIAVHVGLQPVIILKQFNNVNPSIRDKSETRLNHPFLNGMEGNIGRIVTTEYCTRENQVELNPSVITGVVLLSFDKITL